MEIWKDIEGYEGKYQVSNYGRVKSLEREVFINGYHRLLKEKILKENIDAYGYVYYFLFKNGTSKRVKGHRLVAETFIHNPRNFKVINHKDENKRNNDVENLEWCSYEYNLNYGTRSQKYMKKVEMVDLKNGIVIRKFDSLKQAENEMKVSHSKISGVCHGKRKSAGGYYWRFAE